MSILGYCMDSKRDFLPLRHALCPLHFASSPSAISYELLWPSASRLKSRGTLLKRSAPLTLCLWPLACPVYGLHFLDISTR